MMNNNNKTSGLPAGTTIMRAAQVKDYGDIDQVLSVKNGVPIPHLNALPWKGLLCGPYGPFMIIKVLSVSLSPGDWRTLSGKTKNVQGPKDGFPYIPGGDCCGIVVELPDGGDNEKIPFAIGDRVAVRFTGIGPKGALGEYALVDTTLAEKVPDSLSSDEAAALVSASFAIPLADWIKPGDKRVLVLGAGGGLGSHFCQLIRDKGATHVVGVSSAPQRLLETPLLYDNAVDYTKEDVYASEDYRKDPFDVVVDLTGGGWLRLKQDASAKIPLIVKPAADGGRYITVLHDKPVFEVTSMLHFLWKAFHPALFRAIWSRTMTVSRLPSYSFAVLGPEERAVITKTLNLAKEEKLKAAIDPRGPFPFTTEGVKEAFHLQESRHPHGKVIIHVG